MSEFLSAILAFPTVLFTIPLGVVLLYWLLVLLGALDLELFDVLGDADGDVDGDGDTGVLDVLGLGGVPATFALSLLVFLSWILCFVASQALGVEGGLAGAATAALSFGAALPLAGLVVRPLRRFFQMDRAVENPSLVGKVCTVTTLRVDERYGQAEIPDGGAGLLVQVRSARRDNGLRRGDQAIVYEYRDEVFWVSPLDRALAEGTARPEEWREAPAAPRAETESPESFGRRGKETA
jgi:hypothetical protein